MQKDLFLLERIMLLFENMTKRSIRNCLILYERTHSCLLVKEAYNWFTVVMFGLNSLNLVLQQSLCTSANLHFIKSMQLLSLIITEQQTWSNYAILKNNLIRSLWSHKIAQKIIQKYNFSLVKDVITKLRTILQYCVSTNQ